jgi:hypothetical protein
MWPRKINTIFSGIFFVFCWMGAAIGQSSILDRNFRLQDISTLQLSVGTVRASEGACRVDRVALERMGVHVLIAAGMRALTSDESLQISQQDTEMMRRHTEILRAGRAFSEAERLEQEQFRRRTDFIRNLPWIMIMVAAQEFRSVDNRIFCGIAISGDFSAPPVGSPIIGATGRAALAPLLLWRHSTLSAVSDAQVVSSEVERLIRTIIDDFVLVRANQNRGADGDGTTGQPGGGRGR